MRKNLEKIREKLQIVAHGVKKKADINKKINYLISTYALLKRVGQEV
jgi:hypothetical protein